VLYVPFLEISGCLTVSHLSLRTAPRFRAPEAVAKIYSKVTKVLHTSATPTAA
jgi:hypothetical protein